MTRLISTIILLSFLYVNATRADKTTSQGKKDQERNSESLTTQYFEITENIVKNRCKQINKDVLSGKCSVRNYSCHAGWYDRFSKHPDIELETDIKQEWFSQMAKVLTAMYENAKIIRNIVDDGDPEKKPELMKRTNYQKKYFSLFKKLIDSRKKYELSSEARKKLLKQRRNAKRHSSLRVQTP